MTDLISQNALVGKLQVVLGPQCLEMDAIEDVATEAGLICSYALGPSGRVRNSDKNQSTSSSLVIVSGTPVCFVDCDGPIVATASQSILIHPVPEDLARPDQFLEYSLIGRFISLLAIHECLPKTWETETVPLNSEHRVGMLLPLFSDRETAILSVNDWWVVTARNADDYDQYEVISRIPRRYTVLAAYKYARDAGLKGLCPGIRPDALVP
ncbi:MAG: hypothetical protein QXT45_04800 [Candidatus Bilamarchaeaceae archaeon]